MKFNDYEKAEPDALTLSETDSQTNQHKKINKKNGKPLTKTFGKIKMSEKNL